MKPASSASQVQIASDQVVAQLHLPDPKDGFYQGTRFDWSGVITGLQYKDHQYYAPWYTKRLPTVYDYVDDGKDIIAGRQSAITGPAEEFPQPQGFDTARVGETFVKLGVGVLQKATDAPYSCYESYEIVDPGTWSIRTTATSVEFTQELADARTGFGYVYRKTVSVTPGRPDLVIEHALHNTGRVAIKSDQYNHNFLTLDNARIGPDVLITLPFRICALSEPDPKLAMVRENEIRYLAELAPRDVVSFQMLGFGDDARDYDIRVESQKTGAGVRITGNRALTQLALWSIRSVVSMEPFVDVSTEPGGRTMWTYNYKHYVVDT
jgi:hypothetical protein